jgi:hypothetical protein
MVVSITQQPLYYWRKSPWYLMDRLGRLQSRSGSCRKEYLVYAWNETRIPVSYMVA